MERRALLGGLATVLSTGAVAGCLSAAGGTPSDTTTTTPPDATVIDTVDVGDRDGIVFPENNKPHVLVTVNRSDVERTVEVFVDRDGTTVYDRVDHLQPNQAVEIRLMEPAAYTVRIHVGSSPSATIEVPRDRFDCNDSTTRATIEDGGVVDTRTWSTMMACPSTVTDSAIELRDRTCTSREDDTASVRTEDGTVVVEGVMIVPNPCHRVGLRSVTLTDGTLRVVVERREAPQMTCIECVGELTYEATVTLANGYPDRVEVVHAQGGSTTDVTTVTL